LNILAIDGNSILNRAFYGIKLLSTKDGQYTNGIYGFLNIFLHLLEEFSPGAVAVAFDLRAPTFRHKMYGGYKANRKGMPPELASQMPVLKEIITALGYKTVECEGYEADDILGAIAKKSVGSGQCYIATGDRDSMQLVDGRVSVIYASTKAGKPDTAVYTPEKVLEKYRVEPLQLIEVKALMGDGSDNIPGVAGIGEKTATDLIVKYKSVDNIYENIDSIDVTERVRQKLKDGKANAYLSRLLGIINTDAPIETDINAYTPAEPDREKAGQLLAGLEMFKLMERLDLNPGAATKKEEKIQPVNVIFDADFDMLSKLLQDKGEAYFICDFNGNDIKSAGFNINNAVYVQDGQDVDFPVFFKSLLENEKTEKHAHGAKALYSYAVKNNITVKNIVFDAELAGYLLNPNASDYSMRILRLDNNMPVSEIKSNLSYSEDIIEFLENCAVLSPLCEKLSAQLEEKGQTELLKNIEIPLAEVLSSMEYYGFAADKEGISRFSDGLNVKIEALTEGIYNYAEEKFNINSPKQLGEVLFDKLGLETKKKTKSGYSTNAEVLESLVDMHPAIPLILEYRTLSKLKSTYCDGLLKVIGGDGRIHTTFNQTETKTGRISSVEPNLQNIPVRQDIGRELRRFFTAGEGKTLIDADYSQIELRVLAHIADDGVMKEAFNNGDDIHTITASQVFNMPLEMVTPLMRRRAKAVNFGIVYGIGAFSLAKDINVTRKEADSYIRSYLAHYSGVNAYMEAVIEGAKAAGYAETVFKRRRYLPELASSNGMIRSFGERVARNMPIQGTAADIIKIAMIKVYKRLIDENMESKLILQVHDELIVEAPEKEAEKAAGILKEEMENAVGLNVKLLADVKIGRTWYETKE